MIDPARELVFCTAPSASEVVSARVEARNRQLAWLAVLVLHGVLLFELDRAMAPSPLSNMDAIQVVWLPATVSSTRPVPPMPIAPQRRPSLPASASLQPIEAQVARQSEHPSAAVIEAGRTRPRLFRDDGSLVWERPDSTAKPWSGTEQIMRDRTTRLPGQTDAAYAEVVRIRLRQRMTPAGVVSAIVRFLMGNPQKDDCRTIGDRLRQSDDDVVREIDLFKFRKFCAS